MRAPILFVVPFVLVGLAARPSPATDHAPAASLPVRVTKNVGLGATQDIEAALRKPMEDSPIAWDVRVGKTRQKLQLHTCQDYLKVAGQQVETEDPPDQRPFNNAAAHCEALAMLRDARSSERSFLGGFKLDANATQLLPAEFYLDLSDDEARRVRAAARAGRSWKAFDPKVRGKINPRGDLDVKGDGYEGQLTEYARGDFDRDGIEDILIRRMAFPIGGNLVDYAVFLVTRTLATAPMKVLKTWRQAY